MTKFHISQIKHWQVFLPSLLLPIWEMTFPSELFFVLLRADFPLDVFSKCFYVMASVWVYSGRSLKFPQFSSLLTKEITSTLCCISLSLSFILGMQPSLVRWKYIYIYFLLLLFYQFTLSIHLNFQLPDVNSQIFSYYFLSRKLSCGLIFQMYFFLPCFSVLLIHYVVVRDFADQSCKKNSHSQSLSCDILSLVASGVWVRVRVWVCVVWVCGWV